MRRQRARGVEVDTRFRIVESGVYTDVVWSMTGALLPSQGRWVLPSEKSGSPVFVYSISTPDTLYNIAVAPPQVVPSSAPQQLPETFVEAATDTDVSECLDINSVDLVKRILESLVAKALPAEQHRGIQQRVNNLNLRLGTACSGTDGPHPRLHIQMRVVP
jgi:hypothetical protein